MHPYLIHASLGPLESKYQTASRSVQPFLHSSRQCCYTSPWTTPFPLKMSPSRGAIWTPLIRGFLNLPDSSTQPAPQSVPPFLHSSRQSVPILYNYWPPFPLKIAPSHGGSGPPSMVSWAHPSLQSKRHLDRFSYFCRAFLCDRQTDRQTMLLGL